MIFHFLKCKVSLKQEEKKGGGGDAACNDVQQQMSLPSRQLKMLLQHPGSIQAVFHPFWTHTATEINVEEEGEDGMDALLPSRES